MIDPNRASTGAEYRALRRALRAQKRNGKPRLVQPRPRNNARRRITHGNR